MKQALIARQPIVDADVQVRGYELLFRSQVEATDDHFDGESATATVAMNTLLDLGLDTVAGDHPVFVNMTRRFLERELYVALPPDRVVLEVLEDIEPDAGCLEAVARARALGYRIALDDYVHRESMRPLVELADFVKVEAPALDDRQLARHVELLRRPGLTLLAEKVETHERFEFCREAGYDLFQGWFYARPDLVHRRTIPANRVSLLHLLAVLEDPDAGFEEIGELVEQNLSLSHKLLRYVNSALCSLPQEVESVRHACAMLGLERVRSCVTLLLLGEFDDKPSELTLNALSRARMCQLLATRHDAGHDQKYFTVGLFSLLDAYLDRPLEQLLDEIPLSEEIKQAILGQAGEPGSALRTAIACERAEWHVLEHGERDPAKLQRLYIEALDWTRRVQRVLSGPDRAAWPAA